jgi:hypothetical protein
MEEKTLSESKNTTGFNYTTFINVFMEEWEKIIKEEYTDKPSIKVDWILVKERTHQLLGLNIEY